MLNSFDTFVGTLSKCNTAAGELRVRPLQHMCAMPPRMAYVASWLNKKLKKRCEICRDVVPR